MKKNIRKIRLLAFPLAASALLGSCLAPGYHPDARHSTSTGSFGVYTTLPSNYVGNTYYHNGRYYSGGNYQKGRYDYGGRTYTSRYYHNGQYIYGGQYKRHGDSARHSSGYGRSTRSVYQDSDRRPVRRTSDARRSQRR